MKESGTAHPWGSCGSGCCAGCTLAPRCSPAFPGVGNGVLLPPGWAKDGWSWACTQGNIPTASSFHSSPTLPQRVPSHSSRTLLSPLTIVPFTHQQFDSKGLRMVNVIIQTVFQPSRFSNLRLLPRSSPAPPGLASQAPGLPSGAAVSECWSLPLKATLCE